MESNPGARFSKVLRTFGAEKSFVKLRPAYSARLVILYVVKGIKIKITAKFRASRRFSFEDTKRIMSPEIRPKSFGTFEKQATGLSWITLHGANPSALSAHCKYVMYGELLCTQYILYYLHTYYVLYKDMHSYTGLYTSIHSFSESYRAIQGYTGLYRAIQGYTQLYKAIQAIRSYTQL